MKKPLVMAVLLTVISTVAFAFTNTTTELSNTSKFQVVENADSRYDLYYVSENVDNVIVRILDKNGKLINTDKLSDVRAFKRTYNLKGLPAGNYNIEVKNGEGKGSQAIFHNPATKSSLHTIVGQLPNANKFRLFVGPSAANEKVEVKILNDEGKVLKTESISAQDGFSKVYDLTKLNSDFVTFELSNGQDQASYTRDLK